MKCPRCYEVNRFLAVHCRACGAPLPWLRPRHRRLVLCLWLGAMAAATLAVLRLTGVVGGPEQRTRVWTRRLWSPRPASYPNLSQEAMELVRSFPLDAKRGTVEQRLRSAHPAPPGGMEEWSAGAVDRDTYLVQFRPSPGADASLRPMYLFEADLAQGSVKGRNPEALALLVSESSSNTARGKGAYPDERRSSQQHYLSGVIYFQRGDYEKARDEWKLALELDPANTDARSGLDRIEKLYSGR